MYKWFKTFSDDYIHPLLENKKLVLLILGLLTPLGSYGAYQIAGELLLQDESIHKAAPKTAIQNQSPQTCPTAKSIDCSKELASHIIEFNKHSGTHN